MFPLGQMMQMGKMVGAGNPQNLMNQMLQQYQNNPMFQRAQQMAAGKSPQEIRQIANNLCNQRGIDMNNAMEQFKRQFGINM